MRLGLAALAALTLLTAQSTGQAPPPQRIVSLIPATTEMLFAMGAGGRVVGVGNYDRFPPDVNRLPRVGGLLDPYIERVLALRPDLVVVYDTQTSLKDQLARAGVDIFRYEHRALPDVASTLRELGARVGSARDANAAADRMEQQLDTIRRRVAGRRRPKALLVFGREPGTLRGIDASGGYGFLHDLLEIAGGSNVLSDIRRQSVQMSTETILARAPDVIIELRAGDRLSADRLEMERLAWNALPSVPAVKSRRVYLLTGDEFVVPGPRVVEAARRLAEALHP